MLKLISLIPLAASVWFAAFLFLANRAPKSLVSWLALGAAAPLALLGRFVWSRRQTGEWLLALPSLALFLSIAGLFIFLDRPASRYFLIGGSLALVYLDFYFLNLYARHATNYNRRLLQKSNANFIILAIFFSSAALFAWSVFIAHTVWPLVLAIFFIILFLTKAALPWWLDSAETAALKNQLGWLFALVAGLLAAQFFWVLNWWPAGFLIKGAVFTLDVYFMIYLARSWLAETLNRRQINRLAGLFLAIIIIILLLARWI